MRKNCAECCKKENFNEKFRLEFHDFIRDIMGNEYYKNWIGLGFSDLKALHDIKKSLRIEEDDWISARGDIGYNENYQRESMMEIFQTIVLPLGAFALFVLVICILAINS